MRGLGQFAEVGAHQVRRGAQLGDDAQTVLLNALRHLVAIVGALQGIGRGQATADRDEQGEDRRSHGNGRQQSTDRGKHAAPPHLAIDHVQPAIAVADARIGSVGRLHFLRRRLAAHRHEADDLAILALGRHVGAHPIEAAVLAAVLHQANPRTAVLQILPQIGERRFGHVGVADEVVRLTDQLFSGEAADGDEGVVGIGDDTARIGARDEQLLVAQQAFAIGDGLVLAHGGGFRPVGTPASGARARFRKRWL